jgi:hypothetical protein
MKAVLALMLSKLNNDRDALVVFLDHHK